MPWQVVTLNETVERELAALPRDMRSKFYRIAEVIAEFGLPRVREPLVKHLEGKLWEMRMRGRDGIARAIYVAASGQRAVVVRVFVKKTQATPRSEIEVALRRSQEIVP